MDVLEIQTQDESEGAEWLVIYTEHDSVMFRHDFIDRNGTRRTWQDAGSSFELKHLDAVIDALMSIRSPCSGG